MAEKELTPTRLKDKDVEKSVPERIAQALKPTGLTTLDCVKCTVVNGDIYTVRVLDRRG